MDERHSHPVHSFHFPKSTRSRLFGILFCLIAGSCLLLGTTGCTSAPADSPAVPSLSEQSDSASASPATPSPATSSTATPLAPAVPAKPTPSPRPAMSAMPAPDPKETRLPFRRGVNLGNALEAPMEGAWGLVIQDEWMAIIRDAGFDHVRLPVRWSAHAGREAPYTIDPTFLARVDHVLDLALEADLGVVLNVHHYEEMASEPLIHQERLEAIWRQLAVHYAEQPDNVAFELMNEPNGAADAQWGSIWPPLYDIVRESDPDRLICVTGANWSSAGALSILTLPERVATDDRVFATFHFYEPFSFTHQNADWVKGADAWGGTLWNGTTLQQKAITRSMEQVDRKSVV